MRRPTQAHRNKRDEHYRRAYAYGVGVNLCLRCWAQGRVQIYLANGS